jgi:hypothetical protein
VSSNFAHGEVYSYSIMCVTELWQVIGFLQQ